MNLKQNSLIEIGSKGNVVLKFNTDVCVNGRNYAAGEPYLFLRDVNVIVGYNEDQKTATVNQAVAAYSNIFPDTVFVSGVNFSRRLAALLATFAEEQKIFYKSEMKTLRPETDDEGNYFILEDFSAAKSAYIYDENYNLVSEEDYTVQDMGDGSALIEGDNGFDFDDQELYTIFFSSEINGAEFDLVKPHIPYMSMEIQGIGNINKQNAQVIMSFEKVSLRSVLNFNFIEDGVINAPLEFIVIKGGKNHMWLENNGK